MYHADWFRRAGGPFTRSVLLKAGMHACAAVPNESCGLVISGKYVPCENVAQDPAEHFEISSARVAQAYAAGELQAIVHSHPGGPWYPSYQDMVGQIETGVPWAIVVPGEDQAQLACWWGGDRPPVMDENGHHIPREFLHGVSDCYSIIRDYYRSAMGIQLDEVPREFESWKDETPLGGLYLDNFERCGFQIISSDPESYEKLMQPGDLYLMRIRSKEPNHGGVYMGDQMALEHLQGRLSHREPIQRKMKHITHILRYRG